MHTSSLIRVTVEVGTDRFDALAGVVAGLRPIERMLLRESITRARQMVSRSRGRRTIRAVRRVCRCHPACLGSSRRVVFAPAPALLQTGRLPTVYPTGTRLRVDQESKSTSVARLRMSCAIDATDIDFAYARARKTAAASAIGTERRVESIPTGR